MRTVSIFKNGNNRAIRLPRDLDFDGVSELEIVREGDSIILRPVRPTWGSFAQLDRADPDFMVEREDVVSDEGRFEPSKKTWMLDTNICSFIMREQPAAVLKRLEQAGLRGDRIVVSAVTYAEMRFRTSPRPRRTIFSWSTRSARASMPSCPGTGPRWTPRRTSGWRCASPGRRSARTTRPLPATPSRRAPSW